MRKVTTAAVFALLTGSAISTAHAQAFNRTAPKLPARTQFTIPLPAPDESLTVTGHRSRPVTTLRGILITEDASRVVTKPPASRAFITKFKGIDTDIGFLRSHNISKKLSRFLNKRTSIDTLNQVARIVQSAYIKAGRPFVSVTVPRQFVGGGDVVLLVTEYKVNAVNISAGNAGGGVVNFGIKRGDKLSLQRVQYEIDRINDNPFQTASAEFVAAKNVGKTDVYVNVRKHSAFNFPLSAYASYDNAGVPILGQQEFSVGGSLGVWRGGVLSYAFTHAVSDKYSAHSLSYTQQLQNNDKIQVFGTYSYEHPVEFSQGYRFDEAGHSGQASIRYQHDFLPAYFFDNSLILRQQIAAGFDFKTTNNSVEFGGESVFGSNADTLQFPIVYTARENDRFGETTLVNTLAFSPGGLTGSNNNKAFSILVEHAKSRYVYDNVYFKRVTYLPASFSHTLTVNAQISSSNLMYSNQIGLGGLYNGRGYYTDSALGSEGISVQNEINTPTLSFARLLKKSGAIFEKTQIQGGAFFDYGHVKQVRHTTTNSKDSTLASAGLDLRFKVDTNLSVLFNVGWRLKNAQTNSGRSGRGAFGNVSVVVGF